jgi:FkbH-like protein
MTIITFNQLTKNLKKDRDNLPKIKVALLGDSATQFLATAICGLGVENNINIDLFEADYNQIEMQVMDKSSELYQFEPDYTIVFQSTHKLLSKYSKLLTNEQATLADERLYFIQFLSNSVSSKIIYLNYPEIDDMIFGSYANKVESSFIYQLRKLNYRLMDLSQKNSNLFICDIASLQNKYGRDMMFSPSVYVSTEMVLSIDILPYVADRILDIINTIKGSLKKCVILDLDNTLWGGIIGDDGIEGIQLGHGLGIGKAFSEFQYWIKKLKNRGIILAVCSKNNEDTAKEPFIKHPDMVLKLDDIAVFKANWDNKADNIRQIQSILNIGVDSMVFLDDNPVERSIVRENIPDICVPELPEDAGEYLEYLYSLNLFETASYNTADKDRTKQYQVEAERESSKKLFTDEAGFLKSLEMIAEIETFTSFNIPRVAQLSQRSNQFNLRTIRYTEDDIQKIASDDKYKHFCFSLKDKFGDNGLICVIILEKQNSEDLFINTWFMSCRVLKRGMENFTLNTIVQYARENRFKKVIGEYIPTLKNKLVAEHYQNLGLTPIEHNKKQLFELSIDDFKEKECYINKKK